MLASAGVMREKTSTGTKKLRKFPKMPLKVIKTRPSHSGKKVLHAAPRMIATTTLKRSEEASFLKVMPSL